MNKLEWDTRLSHSFEFLLSEIRDVFFPKLKWIRNFNSRYLIAYLIGINLEELNISK
jgi:hypothetical protein